MKEGIVRASSFSMKRNKSGQATVVVPFLCPCCGKKHSVREIYSGAPNFTEPGRIFRCSNWVTVVMPWAARDSDALRAHDPYAQHVLISAIKYLDGTPNGTECPESAPDRRAAINIMFAKLPLTTKTQLQNERVLFWAVK